METANSLIISRIWLLKGLLLFSFFPYLSIIDLPSDTQPYALILSLFILFFINNTFRIPRPLNYYIYFVLFMLVIVGLYSGIDTVFIRSFVGYLSFFAISWASYILFKNNMISKSFFRNIVLIWFLFGLIQKFVYPQFGSQLISGFRTTAERGVVSLAPEPSYYGIMCIFLLIFNVIWFRMKSVYVLCAMQIILFSQSFMMIAYLFIFFYVLLFSRVGEFKKFLLVFVPIVSYFMLNVLFSSLSIDTTSRTITLLSYFAESPFIIFKIDASANDRLAHIFFSFKGALSNYLLPNGFSAWEHYITKETEASSFFWWVSSGRIMSTYGAAIFEMGFLGLAIPGIVNYAILRLRRISKKDSTFLLLFVNIFLLGAIPLAYPPLGIFVGFLLSLKYQCVTNIHHNQVAQTSIEGST